VVRDNRGRLLAVWHTVSAMSDIEGALLNEEQRFVAAVRAMLARPDYLIPLAAAERQFRDHYYGLNSAALLEDLFFDALGTFRVRS
jgi:hypothetical protein